MKDPWDLIINVICKRKKNENIFVKKFSLEKFEFLDFRLVKILFNI